MAIMHISDEQMKQLMLDAKSIAVVGLSNTPGKPSFEVSGYIQSQGYQLIPVNPNADQVLGRKAFGSLKEIQDAVDGVVVFRRPDAIPAVVEDVLQMKNPPKWVWLQLGIRNDDAVSKLQEKGIQVVQDQCYMIEHRRLLGRVNV